MTQARVYVSFDIEHDRELYERLLAQSRGSSFCVSGRSELAITADAWSEGVRHRIRDADEVIVICGEHTEASPCMSAELRIDQEERTP